jgi:beta-galactosidase beta subunit
MGTTTMNQKEKIMGFSYVFILFAAITTVCCLLLFLHNAHFSTLKQKAMIIDKIERVSEYQAVQKKAASTIDLLYEKINNYDPGVKAIYDEDNIKFLVNDLRGVYEKHALDTRYKSFLHVADFYYMWYADKKTLWSIKSNTLLFTKYLEECELGLSNKKDDFSKLKK